MADANTETPIEPPKEGDILFFHAKDDELGLDLVVKIKVLEYASATSVKSKVVDVLKGDEYKVGDEDVFDLQYTSTTETPVTHTTEDMLALEEAAKEANSLPEPPTEFLEPLKEEPKETSNSEESSEEETKEPEKSEEETKEETNESKKPEGETKEPDAETQEETNKSKKPEGETKEPDEKPVEKKKNKSKPPTPKKGGSRRRKTPRKAKASKKKTRKTK